MKQERLKLNDALEELKEKYPAESKHLALVVSNDVVALGTDEAFALKDLNGEIRAYKQRVHLSLADKTLVQPVPGGDVVVSAQGYEVWAEAAGACVIFPKEVLVGNKWQQNPHAERDPENRRILAVHARAVAFRFSSKGIPQVSDWSTIFDTPSYRMIDLLAKAGKFPQAFKLLPSEMQPDDEGTWASYPFDESTMLWVNTSHPEAISWFKTIINREKKSMDFAQTFAKRNALKHLSGLQKAPGKEWNLSVLCWRPVSGNIIKWDATQYSQLQDKVGGLIQGNGEDFAPGGGIKQIERKQGSERTSDEEGHDKIETETDSEDQVQEETIDITPETPKPKDAAVETPKSDEERKILNNYESAIDLFPDEHEQALSELNLKGKPQLCIEEMEIVCQHVSSIVDQGAH